MIDLSFRKASELSAEQRSQAARLLSEEIPHGWHDEAAARAEIDQLIQDDVLLCFALVENRVVGFCGMIPQYGNITYELHPLVVKRSHWRQGIGRMLLTRLEDMVYECGGRNVYLGSDDEFPDRQTSLRGVDLYEDFFSHLQAFDPGEHPTGFYLACGYKLVGVIPDANGPGKPDILMAKRLTKKEVKS